MIDLQKFLTVYASSSDSVSEDHFRQAERLGALLVENNYGLIYGGAKVGLMGAVAKSVKSKGGPVVGVIPRYIHEKGLSYTECDEFIITDTMHERKQIMEERADGFIALPGELGTLEEIVEVMTLKQLKYHNKPIVLINYQNSFSHLLAYIDDLITNKFAKEYTLELFQVVNSVEEVFPYLEQYEPVELANKWFPN